MKRIIVDMMGGDNAPLETIKGVLMAKEELSAEYVLVGDRDELLRVAKENKLSLDGFEIVHTPTVITMEDEAVSVVKAKKDSSMSVGLRLLAEGKGDAFVSTGNTGALFTGANLIVRKIKGTRRPAIAAMLPMNPPVLLLDSGANITVTPEYFEQFAVMGSIYMKKVMGVESPRVGILNNGSEEHKGTELEVEAYKLLSENDDINFVGNIEGNRITRNACDVLVTDGFTGNIFLKTMEGMGAFMIRTLKDLFTASFSTKIAYLLVKSKLGGIKKGLDSAEYGGAPILGIAKPVIKAHGSSKAKAFKNAIRQALACSETDVTGEMSEALMALSERKKAERADDAQKSE
ncbi:MAG: phosphate acyltransferase PlsX [Ruminococcaceae bacterium]|nr:phosphate acyltransferase PlsX [Oscillospiraceae bacterium]